MQQYLHGIRDGPLLDIVTNLRTSCCIILYTYSLSNTTSLSIVFELHLHPKVPVDYSCGESVAFLSSGHSLVTDAHHWTILRLYRVE
jgi:hypothetical protein